MLALVAFPPRGAPHPPVDGALAPPHDPGDLARLAFRYLSVRKSGSARMRSKLFNDSANKSFRRVFLRRK
jgi:hypothetical protein